MKKVAIITCICLLLLISFSTIGSASSGGYNIDLNNQKHELSDWEIKEVEEYNAQRSSEFTHNPLYTQPFGEITPQWAYPEQRVLNVLRSQQEKYYYCGPASIQMMIKYNGKTVSQDTLAKDAGTTKSGSNTLYLRNALNKHVNNYTFGVTRISDSDSDYTRFFNLLNSNIFSKNQPVLSLVRTERLPYYNNHVSNHYIVVRGMTKYIDDGTQSPIPSLTQLNVVDPNDNNNFYGYFTVKLQELFNAVKYNWVQAYNVAY